MTIERINAAKGTPDETIAVSWEEWLASRAKKRELLKRAGLDAPSRRETSYSTSDVRLRRAFGGARAPSFANA